ncbi:MAG: 5'/3'-nucleotidase SurE [Alphaproteobacteria bacterium]|nr:5'/3'-nucleotidase SurE [Alphaproteobacteria bacterium]
MAAALRELARARILLSNDDGVHATGLKTLEKIARTLSDDVWVVAPEAEQSGASHSLTLRHPLRIRRLSDRHFAVDGTPTDSVLLAIRHILKDHPPDLVLSGVNRGGNLGEDVTYSGTIAAAMEGTLMGLPSIALSQLTDDAGPTKWATAERHAPELIRQLVSVEWPRNVYLNINFPNVPAGSVKGVEVTTQGRRKLGDHLIERHDPRGRPYYWIGPLRDEEPSLPNTDLSAVNQGIVSVTPLHLDLTHASMIATLREALTPTSE